MALSRKVLTKNMDKLPPKIPKGVNVQRSGGATEDKVHGFKRKRDFSPLSWSDYFDNMQDVRATDNDVFRIYQKGSEGPVVFFLHGGGHSALSWALLSKSLAGLVKCRVVAMDMRGHGDTCTTNRHDLSAETLANDVGAVISSLYGDQAPPVILVGHSMGGAIAVHAAVNLLVPSLIGLVVIDVVEGSALDSLQSMQSFLRGRPKQFKSLEYAIEWAVRTGQIKNLESARVSMIGQVKVCEEPSAGGSGLLPAHDGPMAARGVSVDDVIAEEEGEGETSHLHNSSHVDSPQESNAYTWRIDLTKTEQFWEGWFKGMSSLFLSCHIPKMLLLAGVDRLDRDLTIGQMQGKFQMQILPQCGHAIQEDQPHKVADALATFMTRHRFAEAIAGFEKPFPCC